MRSRTAGFTILFVITFVGSLAPSTFASHAGAASTVGGFEVDGDFAYPHAPPIAGATRDWATIVSTVAGDSDAADSSTDNVFGGGSKEQEPDNWTFDAGPKPPGKDDLTKFYVATDVTAAGAYLFLGFERLSVEGSGDAHANFEFNQSSGTVVNSAGEAIPARTAGDMLVVYDYAGGENEIGIEVRRWTGAALSGSWVLQSLPAGSTRGDVNAGPVPRPAAQPFGGGTADTLRFGEAALNLSAIFGSQFPGCPGFAQVWVKTRSSGESFNSALKDLGAPEPLSMSRCPDVHVSKSASAGTVDAGDSYTYTLTASNSGEVPATGVVVTDDIDDSLTGVTATFDVDPGTAGGAGVCTVGAGNAVSCAIGTLAASDGNSTGAEPDTAVVSIAVTATPQSCGVIHNVAHVSAADEPEADRADNDSNDAAVEVRCATISLEKQADATAVNAGDGIGFLLTVTNNGSGTAHGVMLSDPLPAGLTWTIDGGTAAAACSIAAGILSCTLGSMAGGATATVHVSAPTGPANCGVIDNAAVVTTTNDGTDGGAASVTIRCPDVVIEKTTQTPTVDAGDTISYDLTVRNTGTGTAYNVTVSDTVPVGQAWSIVPPVAGCAIASGTLSCSLGTMAPGTSVVIHLQATTDASDCGTIDNTATVAATNESATATGNNSAGPVRISVRCAAVQITKTADDDVVSAGDPIGFTITVTNAGPGEARGTRVSDPLPAGLPWSIDGGTASAACSIAAGILSCDLGTLAGGATRTVHVSATTGAVNCGVIDNTAFVTTTNDGSGEASDSVTVRCPDVTVEKTTQTASVDAGDVVSYDLTVRNTGAGNAYGVTVSDVVPAGQSWSIVPPVGGCAIGSGTLSCSLGTMAPGASVVIHLQATTDASDCGTIDNTATVAATNEAASATGNNSAGPVRIVVDCAAIQVVKTADDATVTAGETIGFTITVSNTGSGEARNVHVADVLPDALGLSWSIDGGSAASSCAISGGALTCDLPVLASGASAGVHISSPTTGTTCGAFPNTAAVTTSNDGSATSTATITVECPAGIVIVKRGPSLAHVGDTVVYTMTVRSTTITPLTSVTVTDPLCDATPVYSAGDDGDAVLETGELWHYSCSRVVRSTDPDPLTNTSVATGIGNGQLVQSSDDHVVDLIHPAIAIDKTAGRVSGSPGDPVTYSYRVTNTGDTTLFGVTVTDDKLGFVGAAGDLAPGASKTLTKSTTLQSVGAITNIGTAVGQDVLGKRVTATDPATVAVVLGTRLVATGTGLGPWALGLLLLLIGTAAVIWGRRGIRE